MLVFKFAIYFGMIQIIKTFDEKQSTSETTVTPGISVCFQFWITKNLIHLKAICSKSPTDHFWKRLNLVTLRKYDVVGNEFPLGDDIDENIKLKIMNYNVLSQGLLTAHPYLYRKQKPYMLQWKHRKNLILEEIIKVNPDIICLQEVEERELDSFYKGLEKIGYSSVIKMKTRYKGDGLALYYRTSNIKLIEEDSVEFRQPGIIELQNRDNVGLIARLEKGGKKFVVANTHLLYNPARVEVRLAQVQMLLAELQRIARKNEEEQESILLMGDFNSPPESPVINFILEGQLLSHYRPLPLCLGISSQCTHLQNKSMLYHSIKQPITPAEGQEESIQPSTISNAIAQSYLVSHTFKFSSVYNVSPSASRGVTTYQGKWVMVDFMFYTKGFELLSRLGLPTSSAMDRNVHYLPNDVNPSDHLPLVAEFEFL